MRSAVETEHERSLKVFISEWLPNKNLLAVTRASMAASRRTFAPRCNRLVRVFTQRRFSEWVNVNDRLNKPVPLTPIRYSVLCPLTF